jgi:hypothetical protein
MAKTICKEAIMRNLGYILLSISILLITIGVILEICG